MERVIEWLRLTTNRILVRALQGTVGTIWPNPVVPGKSTRLSTVTAAFVIHRNIVLIMKYISRDDHFQVSASLDSKLPSRLLQGTGKGG